MEMRKPLLAIFAIALIGFSIWYFSAIFLYVVIAGVIALIGQPIDTFYGSLKLGKFKLTETISATLTFLTMLSVFVLFAIIFVPLVTEEAQLISSISRTDALASLQAPIDKIEEVLQNFNVSYDRGTIQKYLQEKLMSALTAANLTLVLHKTVAVMGDFFIAFFAISFLTFFFLRDEKQIITAVLASVPEDYSTRISKVLKESKQMLIRYFIGILIEVFSVMTILSVGLTIAGINNAFLIALFAGIVIVIPYVGPLIGAGFALFIGLTTNPEMTMMVLVGKVVLVFGIAQIADSFLLQPFIFSNSVKAHPLEIFLVILIGAKAGGIGGMVIAVPTYTVLRVIAKEFFINFRLVKRLTEKF